tara:strand:- start:39 stop:233 length:195 start_codon:yes stop_codon:yes gene_type:complete
MDTKTDLTKYSDKELLLMVSNTEQYYNLYYSEKFKELYNYLELNYKYTKNQLKVLKDYINNKEI